MRHVKNPQGTEGVVTVSGDRQVCVWDLGRLGAPDSEGVAPSRCMPAVAGSRVKSFACGWDGKVCRPRARRPDEGRAACRSAKTLMP